MFYEVIPGREVGRIEGALTYFYNGALLPGTVVEIMVGRKKASGVVVKKVAQPEFKCKPIGRILYSKPLPMHLIKTAKWISEYYLAPVSACMGMMLPVGVLKQRRGRKTEQMFGKNNVTGPVASSSPKIFAKQEILGVPLRTHHPSPVHDRLDSAPLRTHQLLPVHDEFMPIPLNPHQKNALKGLQEAVGATKLLHGVTGSGKTNIYLTMAVNALKRQKSVVLLVPEIALTGQLVRVFQEVFGDRITLIHSRQTEAERHQIFDSLLFTEEPQIVIGPRSALFAPLDNLGLIIIDEEHESTYFQENPPRYSAVRVASFMANELKCDCILGSATPMVADYYIAKERGTLISLTKKAKTEAVKPKIQIIDFKNRDEFRKNRYFSDKLLAAVASNLENGRQSLIFHNRRGSAPLTICENCGNELVCPNCFLPLTLHADNYVLQCHTCGFSEKVPSGCPKCGHPELIHKGFGTKLLENELSRLFPKARVMRFDADNKKGEDLSAVYAAVRDGEVDILVGTQTLAKGLDLPRLATVGVVAADTGLMLPDFAAEEKVFQLLTQVIGRVGRGHIGEAEVFIQTYRPEHPVLSFAVDEDYEGFSEYLLKSRRRGGFPPYKYVMVLTITLKTESLVVKKVQEAARKLRADKRFLVSPPMPAFHERTAKGYTWEIIVRSSSRKALLLAARGLDKNFRVTLDPPSLL
ncbi:primosomal protein N' [Candidatus Saccharibacteria bacterium]|nr:primosomal protein N' [Candidatus Saccharibacteria bacterium]